MKVLILARVSTEEQAKSGVSLDDQIKRGIEYCTLNNHTYEVIREAGISGSLMHTERKGLSRLIDLTKRVYDKNNKTFTQEYDAVYVIDYDRITRNDADGYFIKTHLYENQVMLIENGNIIDVNDPNQQMLLSFKNALAVHEKERIKQRVRRSLERSASDGKAKGGPFINYGYKKDENKIMIIDPIEANVVKLIFDMCIKGSGTLTIANHLNNLGIPTKRASSAKGYMNVRGSRVHEFKWRDSVVYGILVNPIYIGKRTHKNHVFNCPSIIDEDTFQYAQECLKTKSKFKDTTNKHFYLLKGLIVCGTCEKSFHGKKREDLSDNQYVCTSQRYGNYCGNRGINIERLNNMVWKFVLDLPNNAHELVIDKNDEYVNSLNMSLSKYKTELEQNTNRMNRIINLYTDNPELEPTLKPNILTINNTIISAQAKINRIERELVMSSSHGELVSFLNQQIGPYKNKELSDKEKQTIIRSFVKFVIVKWNNAINSHIICVQFSINRFSELRLQSLGAVEYKTMGWRYQEKLISYGFRIINPEIKGVQRKDGSVRIDEINIDKQVFGFQVNDDPFSIDKIEKYDRITERKRKSDK